MPRNGQKDKKKRRSVAKVSSLLSFLTRKVGTPTVGDAYPLHIVYFVIAVRAPKMRQAVKLSVFGNARPIYESERSPPLQKSTTFSRFSTVFAQNSTCLVQLFSTFLHEWSECVFCS